MDKLELTLAEDLDVLRHLPETGFEQALFRELLDAKGCFHTDLRGDVIGREDLHAHIEAGGWLADGRLECHLVIGPVTWAFRDPLPASYPIYFSVNERLGPASEARRVVIWWELPACPYSPHAQANEWGWPPVLAAPAPDATLC